MTNYTESKTCDGYPARVYKHTDDAWNDFTPKMRRDGWLIGCMGGFENALIQYPKDKQQKTNDKLPTASQRAKGRVGEVSHGTARQAHIIAQRKDCTEARDE